MDADDVLKRVGSFGRYQIRQFLVLVLVTIVNAWAPLSVVFTHYEPRYYCVDDNHQNASSQNWNGTLNSTIVPGLQKEPCTTDNGQRECQSVLFDVETDGGDTVISEFDLVCSRGWILPLMLSITLAGQSLALLFSGAFSDRFGRRPTFLISSFVLLVSTISMAFSRNVVFYGVSLMLAWTSATVQYSAICVIGLEMVIPKQRNLVLLSVQAGFVIGYASLPLIAYLTHDWHVLLYTISVCSLVFVLGYWYLPETIHWLLSKGRQEGARDLISRIASTNNVPSVMEEVDELLRKEISSDESDSAKTDNRRTGCDTSLFTVPKMRNRLIICSLVWMTSSFAYFGIVLNTSFLPGNRYINCFISALMEIPSTLLAYWALDRIGRARTSLAFFTLAGGSCIAVSFVENVSPVGTTALVITAKTAMSGTLYVTYMHACEISPTLSRNLFTSICGASSSVGSVISPILMYEGRSGNPAISIYVIMGCASMLMGLAIFLFLPETIGLPLPDTMEQALEQKTILQLRKERRARKNKENTSLSKEKEDNASPGSLAPRV